MQKKRIENIPFGEKKVHKFDDCIVIDVKTEDTLVQYTKNARICFRKNEFANYVEGEGWNTRLLADTKYCYGTGFYSKGCENLTKEEQQEFTKFYEEIISEDERWEQKIEGRIRQIQDKINWGKQKIKWKNRKIRQEKHTAEIKQLSPKVIAWTQGQMPSYFFYQTKNRKSTGMCSICGESYTFDREKQKICHNQKGKCPSCGKKIIFKAAGRQCVKTDIMRVVRFQKTKYGLAAIESKAVKKSRAYQKERINIGDSYVCFLDENYEIYDECQGQSVRNFWTDSGRYGMGSFPHGKARIYKGNLKQAIKGTKYQYSGIEEVADWEYEREEWLNILRIYRRQPEVEKVIKAGMKKLVREMYSWDGFLEPGNKLQEILKLTKQNMKKARDYDFGKKEIQILRNDPDGKLSVDEIISLANAGNYLNELLEYTTIRKIATYLKKKQDAGIWLDYLRMAAEQGYNMKDKAVLFPGRLHRKHNELMRTKEFQKNEEKEKQYRKRKGELKKYQYRTKDFLIMIPETLSDIIVEGKVLHHCVGTYVDRVAKGETDILFIRETGKEDIPYYTIEVRNMEIIQYRGAYNNCNHNPVPDYVKKFVKQFENTVLKKNRKAA